MKSIFIFISFLTFSNSLIFKCNYQSQSWSSVGNLYTCNNPSITSHEVKKSLENVIGLHEAGKKNLDVEALNFREQELNEIPPNVNSFFPNLKAILIYKTNLRTISPDDLPFPMLEYFSSMFNKVHSIDGELFKTTPKLKVISFYENLLEHVGENIFKGLSELTHVDFRGNSCVDFWTWTPTELEELSDKLLVECKCSHRCSLGDEVDEINFIVDEFSKDLKNQLLEQNDINDELRKITAENSEKLVKFEKILSDFEKGQCESNDISLKAIFIAFIAMSLLIIFVVVIIVLHRKIIGTPVKPLFGPNH